MLKNDWFMQDGGDVLIHMRFYGWVPGTIIRKTKKSYVVETAYNTSSMYVYVPIKDAHRRLALVGNRVVL